jgi:septal ring factor EnvC (AmiA/AmiB activator)
LSLKAFVAARCAARQLAAEGSSNNAIADLEVKVAALEQEKAALQQRINKSAEENTTLTSELLATAKRAVKAEDMAKAAKGLAEEAETRRTLMRNHYHTFKESVRTGAAKLQKELSDLLEKYGLEATEVSSEDTVGVDALFK